MAVFSLNHSKMLRVLHFNGYHLAFTVLSGAVKLFEDPDLGGTVSLGDSLLLPNAYQKTKATAVTKLDEDVNDLFRSVNVYLLSYKVLSYKETLFVL